MSNNNDCQSNPNNIATVQFNVTVTIILIVAGLGLSIANFGSGPKTHDAIVFFLLLIGGACQISLAYYSLKNLQLATRAQSESLAKLREQEGKLEKQRKADKAASFAARWNEAAMIESRKVVREITSANDTSKVVSWVKENIDDNSGNRENCIRHVLNFLEELSTAVNEEYCDENYIRRLFKGVVINIWSTSKLWVDDERLKKNRPTIFIETETLYNRWNQGIN